MQGQPNVAPQGGALEVGQALEVLEGVLGLLLGVEGGEQALAMLAAPLVLGLGVLFLDRAGVGQDDAAEVDGRRCRVDGAAEALGDQAWDEAAVVRVGVRQDDAVQVARVEGQGPGVELVRVRAALREACVDQEPLLTGLEQVGGTRDGLGGAQEV
ncbi:hypothetical protein D3C87_1445500 [compost metagenome]